MLTVAKKRAPPQEFDEPAATASPSEKLSAKTLKALDCFPEDRNELTEQAELRLTALEVILCERVQAELNDMRPFYVHWQLRDYLCQALRRDKAHPPAKLVMLHCDWQDRIVTPFARREGCVDVSMGVWCCKGWPGGVKISFVV